jgi:hypothetical protein
MQELQSSRRGVAWPHRDAGATASGLLQAEPVQLAAADGRWGRAVTTQLRRTFFHASSKVLTLRLAMATVRTVLLRLTGRAAEGRCCGSCAPPKTRLCCMTALPTIMLRHCAVSLGARRLLAHCSDNLIRTCRVNCMHATSTLCSLQSTKHASGSTKTSRSCSCFFHEHQHGSIALRAPGLLASPTDTDPGSVPSAVKL